MRKNNVTVTEKAVNDIMEISSYISDQLFNNESANRLVNELEKAIKTLEVMPKRNSLVSDNELANRGIRRLLVENYIIFYIYSERDMLVSIIRVLYNKRDWRDLI